MSRHYLHTNEEQIFKEIKISCTDIMLPPCESLQKFITESNLYVECAESNCTRH